MHKIVTGFAPQYLTERITFRNAIHNHNTRNQNLIQLKRLKKAVKNGAFFVKTAKDYNHLLQNKLINTNMKASQFKHVVYKQIVHEQNEPQL